MKFINKKLIFCLLTICFLTILLSPQIIFAELGVDTVRESLNVAAKDIGEIEQGSNLPAMLGQVINYFFAIIGVVFLVMTLFGGLRWMTAGGNEDKVKQGKTFIIGGINGIIIIFLAYAMVYVILAALGAATTN